MLKPECKRCGEYLRDYGGLLFSPPIDGKTVKKAHLCIKCYEEVDKFIDGWCQWCKQLKPCDCTECSKCGAEYSVNCVIDEAHDGTPTMGYHCVKCDDMW